MKTSIFLSLLLITMPSFAHDQLVTIGSNFSVKETADRLEHLIQHKGLTFFTRIDHAANAKEAGLELRPTELILFGNPKVGTLLMHCGATVAIELPQKALIWQDEADQVWFAYNNPEYLKAQHKLEGCEAVIEKISGLLKGLSVAATQK